MDVNKKISDFLRDAQYRIGELTGEMNTYKDDPLEYHKREKLREQLSMVIRLVWYSRHDISGGSHYLYAAGWTDEEIIAEMDRWREHAGMNPIPWVSFPAYYPTFTLPGNSGSSDLPSGEIGQVIGFKANGTPMAEYIDAYVGMDDAEDIYTYFNGRE